MTVKLTLDTNCIIALENGEAAASEVHKLVQLTLTGNVNLAILGISASENQKAFYEGQDFTGFQKRVSANGLGNLIILKPIAFFDVTFWDWCILPSERDSKLLNDLWSVIFPRSETNWAKRAASSGIDLHDNSSKESKKWRNELCDAQIAWATIHHGYDALVTLNTSDFQRNRSELKSLGLSAVWTPKEALQNI